MTNGPQNMDGNGHVYDAGFFDYIEGGSRSSADSTVAVLRPLLAEGSTVLDVGCGQGVWARRFAEEPNVAEAVGVDGDYVDRQALAISPDAFVAHDLTTSLDLGRRFTLALSLEVGEHLPPAASATLVETLVGHADIVMFSAAVPGQGGEHHINERPLEDWRKEFARHGYVAFDFVRPRLAGQKHVEPWYRYNILLYVKEDRSPDLPQEVQATRLAPNAPVPQAGSLLWRLRCALIRPLPRSLVDRLALVKHAFVRATKVQRSAQ
ncbi:MAG: class I SAM-dependent methyltransferase [Pseudomonadota bacterium]